MKYLMGTQSGSMRNSGGDMPFKMSANKLKYKSCLLSDKSLGYFACGEDEQVTKALIAIRAGRDYASYISALEYEMGKLMPSYCPKCGCSGNLQLRKDEHGNGQCVCTACDIWFEF